MGRGGCDPTAVSSSIALLQERFRELERMKERRVGRELTVQLLPPRSRVNSTIHISDCSELSYRANTNPRQTPQDFLLSLGLNSQSPPVDPRAMKNSTWSCSLGKQPHESFEDSDVDTSLHL